MSGLYIASGSQEPQLGTSSAHLIEQPFLGGPVSGNGNANSDSADGVSNVIEGGASGQSGEGSNSVDGDGTSSAPQIGDGNPSSTDIVHELPTPPPAILETSQVIFRQFSTLRHSGWVLCTLSPMQSLGLAHEQAVLVADLQDRDRCNEVTAGLRWAFSIDKARDSRANLVHSWLHQAISWIKDQQFHPTPALGRSRCLRYLSRQLTSQDRDS